MKNSKEVLNQILDLTEQAAAVRRIMTFGMPNAAWKGCRTAVNALLDKAEQLLEDNRDVITDKDSFAARVAINRVLDIGIKDTF
jgi:exosome complex RNA-binding protein Csl4